MAGPGGVASPLGTMTVPPGDSVTISATANDGYAFTNWSLPYGSGTFANSFASNTTVVLTSTSATVRANFALIGMVLVRSASSVSVPEGGTHTFQLKLLSKPPVDIAVNVAPTAGDANITVTGGANLTFTTNNWDTYQTVTLAAAEDGDTVNGTTTITCSSPDADSTLVTATEVDNDTTLTVNAGTGGNTTPSGATVVTMDVATAITATASANYAFTNWSVTSGAATFANSNAASTMVTISAPATILANFVKTNINQTPVITEGASPNVTMSEDGAPTAFALTLHATDADGDTLTWSVATPAAHGTATASGTGASQAIAYTPTVNYSGADSFAIQVSDGVGGAATTTVAVTIQPVNDAPVAFDQSVSTAKNTAKAITLSGSDLEGSNLTYAVATQPAYGTLSGTGANWTYTPNTGYWGSDSFTFRVNDGALDSPPATVSILVGGISATGGTVTNYTQNGIAYRAHIFTTTAFIVFSAGGDVEFLVVAGGGGGNGGDNSNGGGGGGGAGGLIYSNATASAISYDVVVGGGGAGGTDQQYTSAQRKGTNSSIFGVVAIGGGGGARFVGQGAPRVGGAGGSGGGGFRAAAAGGAGTAGQGTSGGAAGSGSEDVGGGGGGGAGSAGSNGTTTVGGSGGNGMVYDIAGSSTYYAGGGGGGADTGAASNGGLGGGGAGGAAGGANGVAGGVATGGGGGGGGTGRAGGNGGSGIVIVRYVVVGGGAVAPAAPSGLTATTAATNQINLAWTDLATNETGYVVNRSLDSTNWTFVTLTAANATNYSHTGLTTNTLYYYRVAATNAGGLSAYGFASARTWSVYETWRQTQFGGASLTNSAISGATADPDHDGLNNEQEYWAGTSPTNAASCLALYSLTNNPVVPGEYLVRWQSVSDRWYTVQAATNLLTGFNLNLRTNIPATPPVNVHTDNVGGAGQKFYRVKVE
jgi:hypothetical protein